MRPCQSERCREARKSGEDENDIQTTGKQAMTHSTSGQATHTNIQQTTASFKIQAGSPKPDISKDSKRKINAKKITKKPIFDMYQEVTNQMIEALEKGVKPWVCPWETSNGGSGLPINFQTGNTYSGINILLLWAAACQQGFASSQWLTFKQAVAVGGCVRKGEKGTRIVFYKTLEVEDKKTGEKDNIPMLKSFVVFNVDQIDGLEIDAVNAIDDMAPFEALEHVEQFFLDTGAVITEKGESAFFRPSTDEIVLPSRERFTQSADFYATGLHELTHWSGAKSRLNRPQRHRFGSEDYAFEELIAELGCSFLMASLGVTGEVQHESYIASWLQKLHNDKKYIFKAASAASKAHQYLTALTAKPQAA
jgi:antirestriction protein ArdC